MVVANALDNYAVNLEVFAVEVLEDYLVRVVGEETLGRGVQNRTDWVAHITARWALLHQ